MDDLRDIEDDRIVALSCGFNEIMTDEEYYDYASFNNSFEPGQQITDHTVLGGEDIESICFWLAEGCTNREVTEATRVIEEIVRDIRNKLIFATISNNYDYPIIISHELLRARAIVLVDECSLPPAGLQHILGVEYKHAERLFKEIRPGQRYWEDY